MDWRVLYRSCKNLVGTVVASIAESSYNYGISYKKWGEVFSMVLIHAITVIYVGDETADVNIHLYI